MRLLGIRLLGLVAAPSGDGVVGAVRLGELERLEKLGDLAAHARAGFGDDVAQPPAFDQAPPKPPGEAQAEGDGHRGNSGRDGESHGDVCGEEDEPRRKLEQKLGAVLDPPHLVGEDRVEVGRSLAPQVGPRGVGDRGIGPDLEARREIEPQAGDGVFPQPAHDGPRDGDAQEHQQKPRQRARQQGQQPCGEAGRRRRRRAQGIQERDEQGQAHAVAHAGKQDQHGDIEQPARPDGGPAQLPGRRQVGQHRARLGRLGLGHGRTLAERSVRARAQGVFLAGRLRR